MSLGGNAQVEIGTLRGPVGGATTLHLGDTTASEVFGQFSEERHSSMETPDPAPRFSQAPGGDSSINFEKAAAAALEPIPESTGGPVGGESTFVLGDGARTAFPQAAVAVETPDAAPRFPQAPGGSSTLILGASAHVEQDISSLRGPVGGMTHVVLGTDSDPTQTSQREGHGVMATPDAALRFQQAPGGTASIILGGDGPMANVAAPRGPLGGVASVVLGSDNSWEESAQRRGVQDAGVDTPGPAPRFTQAPGGAATVILGGGNMPADFPVAQTRTAPGGNCTLVLGGGYPHDLRQASSNQYASGANQNAGNVLTDRPSTRLHHAPGGTSTICLGDEVSSEVRIAQLAAVSAATPSQKASEISEQPRLLGAATLVLGGDYPNDRVEAKRTSSNAFANGANQNAGNTITDRSSTRLHHAPGGKSTICLGDGSDLHDVAKSQVSSNKFASGANQNNGNSITDRSTTRIHQAPGGNSSICLGAADNSQSADTAPVLG